MTPGKIKCLLVLLFSLLGAPSFAQSPLSAIDFDAENPDQFLILPQGAPQNFLPPSIVSAPLASKNINATGLVPSTFGGLPSVLWSAQSDEQTAELINSMPILQQSSAQNLFFALLTSETTIVENGPLSNFMFETRVQKLFDLGASDAAYALLEQVSQKNHALMRIALDIGFIRTIAVDECRDALALEGFSIDLSEQIYCKVMLRDWETAETLLTSAEALGLLDDNDLELLWQFIDPEYAETAPPPTIAIEGLTPLRFRLLLALGKPKPVEGLPAKYLWPYLTGNMGWRMQIEAAEKLVKTGAAGPAVLIAAYTQATAAASGGIWDRAAAIVELEKNPSEKTLTTAFEIFNATSDDDLLAKSMLEMNLFSRLPDYLTLAQKLLIQAGEPPSNIGTLQETLLGHIYSSFSGLPKDVGELTIPERRILEGLTHEVQPADAPAGFLLLNALHHLAQVPYDGHGHLTNTLTTLRALNLRHIAQAIGAEMLLEQTP